MHSWGCSWWTGSLVWVCVCVCACTTTSHNSGNVQSTESCLSGSPLAGTSYDIAKSRFAFGSTPVLQDAGSLVRWVGSHGVVGIFSDGFALGSMNAGAPESNLPDWSSDSSMHAAHVIDYWVSMGVTRCQIAGNSALGSAGGGGSVDGGFTVTAGPTTIVLSRGVEGVPVVESLASARFDVNDQTTEESFYWPEIPADVVSAAIAFKNHLADPSALAAYKAKLPADAQGQGRIVIHHTSAGTQSPFQTATTYDVLQTAPPPMDASVVTWEGQELSFDQNGNPVTTVW